MLGENIYIYIATQGTILIFMLAEHLVKYGYKVALLSVNHQPPIHLPWAFIDCIGR